MSKLSLEDRIEAMNSMLHTFFQWRDARAPMGEQPPVRIKIETRQGWGGEGDRGRSYSAQVTGPIFFAVRSGGGSVEGAVAGLEKAIREEVDKRMRWEVEKGD